MTLDELKPGESARITGMNVDDTTLKPITMGIVEGSTISCMTKMYQTIEFNVYGTHIAISKHTAKKFDCELRQRRDK